MVVSAEGKDVTTKQKVHKPNEKNQMPEFLKNQPDTSGFISLSNNEIQETKGLA